MRLGGSNQGHRACVITDDDLAPGAYPRQHSGEVAGGFRFRDVDDVPRHSQHYIVFETCEAARLPTPAIGRQTSSQIFRTPITDIQSAPRDNEDDPVSRDGPRTAQNHLSVP
jgi:hypothetical protein